MIRLCFYPQKPSVEYKTQNCIYLNKILLLIIPDKMSIVTVNLRNILSFHEVKCRFCPCMVD